MMIVTVAMLVAAVIAEVVVKTTAMKVRMVRMRKIAVAVTLTLTAVMRKRKGVNTMMTMKMRKMMMILLWIPRKVGHLLKIPLRTKGKQIRAVQVWLTFFSILSFCAVR